MLWEMVSADGGNAFIPQKNNNKCVAFKVALLKFTKGERANNNAKGSNDERRILLPFK